MTYKKKIYKEEKSNINFSEIEVEVLAYWKKHNIFQKSIDTRPAGALNEFVFYDGPPFANGLPHYGHLLTGFIKDVFARYQTIKGKRVERRFGWDCHGLPAEMGAEKELNFSGRRAITEYGIDKFNSHCQQSVMQYSKEWEKYVDRQARWVDFENSYKTMDKDFMESVLWAFKTLYDKGLIYESMRVMPYSWACETPLSNFETRLDNSYRERADKAVTVSFLLDFPPSMAPCKNDGSAFLEYRILAWTTTPWTLPSNLALAVNSKLEYLFIPKGDVCYIIASFARESYAKELSIVQDGNYSTCLGKDLVGMKYHPLFDYFMEHKNAFVILDGEFVTEGDGTGVVHLAPGFGEDDQLICEKAGIELVCPVDNAGKFTNEVQDFASMQVFDANDKIIIKLKENGSWIKTEQYLHNYPHCWRTDTPLIYKAVPSWYVEVTKIKDRMVELNTKINWIPTNVKDGLFGKWLENARDWSISRNRFWGTPIPVWRSSDPLYPRIDVYGSIEELERDFGVKINDLHRPFIDELTRPNPDDPTGNSVMKRVEDVFDCWFESGSMPYAQVHYPFENKDWFESHSPADFIVEYVAQTRGWFYTLMVLSTALFDRPPFLNCICHGVILDSTGQKLSKRLNNYADPLETFNSYGSDALRITMLSSNVIKGQELLIDKDGKMVFDAIRLFIKPIWNAYNFFTLYANADEVEAKISYESTNILDQYIFSKLKIVVSKIENAMDQFNTQDAYNNVIDFFEILNNWYIRRSRNRFWKSEKDADKLSAYNSLYTVLIKILEAISPLLPLISEHIYLALKHEAADLYGSVHLVDFPKLDEITVDESLVRAMDEVLAICNSALFIRSAKNIRVRQPLASLEIISQNADKYEIFLELIKDEINVKEIVLKSNLANYAQEKLTINFAVLGKRLPAKMKQIIAASKNDQWKKRSIDSIEIADEILYAGEYEIILQPNFVHDGAKAVPYQNIMLILDLHLTESLKQEGVVRDIIRLVQQARKDANYLITDHIYLQIIASDYIMRAVDKHRDLISEQTLSKFAIIETSSNYRIKSKIEMEDVDSHDKNNSEVEILLQLI